MAGSGAAGGGGAAGPSGVPPLGLADLFLGRDAALSELPITRSNTVF
jgi:hypothetical protein